MGKIIENYSLQEVLGEGVYGKVYKAVNLKNKEEVAVKVISADKFKKIPRLEEFTVNSINTLSNLEPNPHIVKYLDMLKTTNNFYFVYEYCNGGTLEKLMKQYQKTADRGVPQQRVIQYLKQMIEAFKTLTKNNIMHRDLKPDNILIHNGIVKLADFGFCKILTSPEDLAQTMLGSPIYMAPEVLKGEEYTLKADIWSLGVVLYQMLFGECPFQSNSIAKLIQILQVNELVLPRPINPSLEKLLRRMLVKDQYKRIDWNEIFEYKILEEPDVKRNVMVSQNSKNGLSFTSTNSTNTSNNSNYQTNWTSSENLNIYNHYQPSMIRRRSPMKFDLPQSTVNTVIKGPVKQKNEITNIDHYLNTHRKVIEINKLAIETLKRNLRQSIAVTYLLFIHIERQLAGLADALDNEIDINLNNAKIKQFKSTIQKQLEIANHYKKEFEKYVDNNAQVARNKHIKQYINEMRLDEDKDLDSFAHASQLLDYFQESILLKKDAYQRLTKEQLSKQIQNKLKKIA